MRTPFKVVGVLFFGFIALSIGWAKYCERNENAHSQNVLDESTQRLNELRYKDKAFKAIVAQYDLREGDNLEIWYCEAKGNEAIGNAIGKKRGQTFTCRFKLTFDNDGFMIGELIE